MRHRTGMCVLMMILGLSLSACGGAEGGNRAEQLALDIRGEYLDVVNGLFPDLNPGGLLPSCLVGGILFVAVTILNAIIVRRKINEIWMRK